MGDIVKIVLPVHHFLPRYTAGAELYTYRLARWLRNHGHQVEVVAVEAVDHPVVGRLDVTADIYDGFLVHRLRFNREAGAQYWEYDNPLIGEWFAQYLEHTHPDLVHFQAGYLIGVAPLRAAVNAGVPVVLTLHDYWFICPRITLLRNDGALCHAVPDDPAVCAWCLQLDRRRFRLPEQATGGWFGKVVLRAGLDIGTDSIRARRAALLPALRLPDAVIVPSHFLASHVRAYVAADRLHVVRIGLDLSRFAGIERRNDERILRIGCIGQIAPHKGVHLLIRAFRALRPKTQRLELHIYGGLTAHPAYVARLRRLAGSDDRIYFHGRVENVHIPDVLASLNVAVTPSIWYENSPIAILEAHAAGTPVVTAGIGGMAELVRDGVDGLHFRCNDSTDLARVLQRLIDDPDLLPRLRSGIRQPHSVDQEMSQLLNIYRQIIAQRSTAIRETI
jgi:glycosyltransferase involved in cell wall biosynthesis